MRRFLVVCLILLAGIAAAGQSPTPKRRTPPATGSGTPPRAPDGHPDLQGVWLNNAAAPLERPKALEGREFLTDEEVAELRNRAARLFSGGDGSDFAGGDAFFLALLANPDRYVNSNTTGGDGSMIERVFDNRTSLIVDPRDGRIPPLTPEGQERVARTPTPTGAGPRVPDGPEDFSNALRCLTYGTPRLGANNTSGAGPLGYYQIVQTPGYVVLMLEAIHEARIIPLNGGPHLPPAIRKWNGDSRGRWEGDTLVIETTNFSPHSSFMGSSGNLQLVERLTRTAADTVTYEITVSDSTTWTHPWTAVIRLKRSEERLFEYACHEGNLATMTSMLGAARAKDKGPPRKER